MTSYLVHLLASLLAWLVGLLPSYSGLPAQVTASVGTLSANMKGLDCIIPVATYKAQFAIVAAIAFALLMFRFFAWAFRWKVTKESA